MALSGENMNPLTAIALPPNHIFDLAIRIKLYYVASSGRVVNTRAKAPISLSQPKRRFLRSRGFPFLRETYHCDSHALPLPVPDENGRSGPAPKGRAILALSMGGTYLVMPEYDRTKPVFVKVP